MICRLIAPAWLIHQGISPSVLEGDYTYQELISYNEKGYNIYFFPNSPSSEKYRSLPTIETGRKRYVQGIDIDTYQWIFVDMDLKDKVYATKDEFIELIGSFPLHPTKIVDSGNGIHVYWKISDLDAMSFLRLGRRLMRTFKTDEAVQQLKQLMRVPGTINTKYQENFRLCEILYESDATYTCEEVDKVLTPIQLEDEQYCQRHYDSCFSPEKLTGKISDQLPQKFLLLSRENPEVKSLFYDSQKDRSSADFRLGHLMYAAGLNKDEAMAVLMQTAKSAERHTQHRYSYATNITDKIWVEKEEADNFIPLSRSVAELLSGRKDEDKGIRFPCHPILDSTENGFRLKQVMTLIGASGNGKSTVCLNVFFWFLERNLEYNHLYVSLEQPAGELAEKWRKMTQGAEHLYDKVHILDNYNDDGTYRELGIKDIENYVIALEKHTGRKTGAVVLDHIGIIKQDKGPGEFSGLTGVCKRLKAFANRTNTFTIALSQTSREKGGGGDIELDMDAGFGTSSLEHFSDFVFSCWQPLKRIYKQAPDMTITAFKMCKVRVMDLLKDKIKANTVYALMFDTTTDRLRELTSDEHRKYDYWARISTQLRNKDKKESISTISVIDWTKTEGAA